MVKSAVSAAAISGLVQVIVPVSPTVGTEQSQPAGAKRAWNRMVSGNTVVDHERITGLQPGVLEAIAVYQVSDGLIRAVWFY